MSWYQKATFGVLRHAVATLITALSDNVGWVFPRVEQKLPKLPKLPFKTFCKGIIHKWRHARRWEGGAQSFGTYFMIPSRIIYGQSPTFLSLTKSLFLVISMQIWTLLISPNHPSNVSVTVFSVLTKVNYLLSNY